MLIKYTKKNALTFVYPQKDKSVLLCTLNAIDYSAGTAIVLILSLIIKVASVCA